MASLQFEHETLGLKYFGGPGHDFGLPQSTLSGRVGHVLLGGLPVDISPSMIPSLHVTPEAVSRLLRRKRQRRVSAAQRSFLFASSVERLPQFWQKRFYDFNVWSRKKKIEKLGYMHANPLKCGLVDDPKHWPWSSYAFYQQRGEVLIDVDPVN
ncbi:MAG TPA: hypothetical protein VGS15_09075 [Candidatus Acidoferrales bacterium]|nr:hypothetical protein [Candidatus Acidoferrales bacterium]